MHSFLPSLARLSLSPTGAPPGEGGDESDDHSPKLHHSSLHGKPRKAQRWRDRVVVVSDDSEVDEDSDGAIVRRRRAGGSAKQRMSNALRVDEDLDVRIATYALGKELLGASSVVSDSTNLVKEHVYVKDVKDGPNQPFIDKFKKGLLSGRGWLVTATTEEDQEVWDPEQNSMTTLRKDTMVGVILVAAKNFNNGEWCSTHGGLRADVVSLGTHRLVRRKGVSPQLWGALLKAIECDPNPNIKAGKLTLFVTGGPCLNNDASRTLYERWGFCGPAVAEESDSICGWSLEFVNGRPSPRA